MSSYLRSIPNKFTPFVNTRRQVINIDHQLPNHVKSSLFLEEFLDIQTTTTNVTTNSKEKTLNSVVASLSQNVPIVFFSTNIEKPKILSKRYNGTKHQVMKLQQQRLMNVTMLNVINSDATNMAVLKYNRQWEKSVTTNFNDKNFDVPCTEMVLAKNVFNDASPNSEKKGILYTEVSPNVQNEHEKKASMDRKPSETQLINIFKILQDDLPLLFVKQFNYAIYTEDMTFVNNIKGTTCVGILNYVKQIMFLKIIGHLKYAYIKLDVLKMTIHPEDNSIKVRWRIVGISGTRIFLTFWKFKVWNVKDNIQHTSSWYDGFSTFYVNNDGKIFKHVVDKMMPDQDVEEKLKTPIETKLALFAALLSVDSLYLNKFCSKRYPQLFRIK
ncbi:Uncharacterized protein WH47_12761 [Habropoda laboriosa]|uniref:Uncharacterized protein n=1 Tax=Habropoda laboriosa TaxID=597456 RepID=A0A0L7R505_9HYME|nr:PREDICTED: uncharacterized protein LOC108571745 [Habropoda laboriosa]KOC65962.1 Uncharacterized protein WH47_12761 [Habropoda laboriosa]